MKRALVFSVLAIALICCRKKETVINNYTPGTSKPAFVVNGINDISFVSFVEYVSTLALTVQYQDSAQERVSLSLSGLPADITFDSTWTNSGIPTFSTSLDIFDTSTTAPGIYPVSLIATTASGKTKIYPFNIKILPMPTAILGKYNTCTTSCNGVSSYTDSVYADPAVPNKVWFSNFANTGEKVYGLISVPETLTIPSQAIAGITYYSTGTVISLSNHQMFISVHRGAATCNVNIR